MAASQNDLYAGYSPDISMELELHGERFNVAATGSATLRLRNPRTMPPGRGTLRMTVNGNVTTTHVELIEGINPDQKVHAYKRVEQSEGAAA
jgi:hypothetical protein